MDEQCGQCDSSCCRYYCFEIDKPDTYEEFEDVRWYLTHAKTSVHIDEDGDWCILIENPCTWLEQTPRGLRCRNYEHRPLICRKFSPASCEFTRGGYDYEELFETPEQLEAYARRMLGEEAYEQAQAAARRRLQRGAKKP